MKIGLNTFTLKWIAVLAMITDHVGKIFFPEYIVFDAIGRLSFPIFAYLLVEGFYYTKDLKKYMIRLGAFALLSEIPFNLAFYGKMFEWQHQNVFFTLFMGLVLLCFLRRIPMGMGGFLYAIILVLAGDLLKVDYGGLGLLVIFWFYHYRERRILKVIGISLINLFLMGHSQIYAMFALIPICLHNQKQGPKMKWFFYGFYPAHLLILYFISLSI